MTIVAVLLGIVLAIAAIVVLLQALRGLRLAMRVVAQPTRPIAQLSAGPVEVAGTLAPIGDPILSASGVPCVAVTTKVTCRRGRGKGSTTFPTPPSNRFADARLTDRTGSCRVDLGCAQIVGPRRSTGVLDRSELPADPWLVEMLAPEADNFDIEETIVPVGATVLVSGQASEAEARMDGAAYREAAIEWKVEGRPEHMLVVSAFGQGRLLFVTVLPALLLLSIAGYLAFAAFVTVAAML